LDLSFTQLLSEVYMSAPGSRSSMYHKPGRLADVGRGRTPVAWSPSTGVSWPGYRAVWSETGWVFVAASQSAVHWRWWRYVDTHRWDNSQLTLLTPALTPQSTPQY